KAVFFALVGSSIGRRGGTPVSSDSLQMKNLCSRIASLSFTPNWKIMSTQPSDIDEVLYQVRSLLDANHPSFPGSYEMQEMLSGPARGYIMAAVMPLLDALEKEISELKLRAHEGSAAKVIAITEKIRRVA